MKKEYLKECDSDICAIKMAMAQARRELKQKMHSVEWCERRLEQLQEKRHEIMNLGRNTTKTK